MEIISASHLNSNSTVDFSVKKKGCSDLTTKITGVVKQIFNFLGNLILIPFNVLIRIFCLNSKREKNSACKCISTADNTQNGPANSQFKINDSITSALSSPKKVQDKLLFNPPPSTLEDEILKLHDQIVQLVSCSRDNFCPCIKKAEEEVARMIPDAKFISYTGDLKSLYTRLVEIQKLRIQNPDVNIALDCFGLLIKMRSMFCGNVPSLMPSQIPSASLESTLASHIHDANLTMIESFILSNDYDVNLPRGVIVEFAIRKACELSNSDPQKALNLIELMIRAGANLNAVDIKNKIIPPLHSVCMSRSLVAKKKILELLLINGANPNLKAGKYLTEGAGPLPLLIPKLFQRKLLTEEMVQLLMDYALDLSMRTENSMSPLDLARGLQLDSLVKLFSSKP